MTMLLYLIPLNCTLKSGKMVSLVMYNLPQLKIYIYIYIHTYKISLSKHQRANKALKNYKAKI